MLERVHKYVHQGILEEVAQSLFPNEDRLVNARKNAQISNPETGKFLELDVWYPSIDLTFEFQDPYHYATTWDSHVPLAAVQLKDAVKQSAVQQRGHTLVLVPFWWDGKRESLAASVRFLRPDLLSEVDAMWDPIPLNPTLESDAGVIPGVGEMMLASFPNEYNFNESISYENSWWAGEKYDGVRFCWNANTNKLFSLNTFTSVKYTRSGIDIALQASFIKAQLPIFMDGEIWFGRGSYHFSQQLITSESLVNWPLLRIVAFDVPNYTFQDTEFELRYSTLLFSVPFNHPFIIVAARLSCTQGQQAQAFATQVLDDGGEGLILRKPGSLYVPGRSSLLFKLKAAKGDKEALVIGVKNDNYHLRVSDGTTFTIENQRFQEGTRRPIKGDIVTFTYEKYSRASLPVNPKILRVRNDVLWNSVSSNSSPSLTVTSRVTTTTPKPIPAFNIDKRKHMRQFFEKVARNLNFDPHVADNWYTVSVAHLVKTVKGMQTALSYFKGSLSRALIHLFPELHIDQTKMLKSPHKYWKNIANRRSLLDKFAAKNGLDSLSTDTWYNLSKKDLLSTSGMTSVLSFYNGSFAHAVKHLYPELHFDFQKFLVPPYSSIDLDSQRKAFENFAKSRGFDPLVAANWYHMSRHDIVNDVKNGNTIIGYYKGNYAQAIVQIFPEIGLVQSKFAILPKSYWNTVENRRGFFLHIAKSRKMDPLVANNWYKMAPKALLLFQGYNAVLSHYKGDYKQALIQLFPEINWDIKKFAFIPRGIFTKNIQRRKEEFIAYAKHKCFDPLIADNWYNTDREDIVSFKGIGTIIQFYGSSYIKSLLNLFPNIGLDEAKFTNRRRFFWQDINNRRQFFLKVAKDHKLDPKAPESWYSLHSTTLLREKGSSRILHFYEGSFAQSLILLFPELELDKRKFLYLT